MKSKKISKKKIGPHGKLSGPHGFGPHGFGPHGFGPHGFGPHGKKNKKIIKAKPK
jgi:hypothetical protein